MNCTSAVAMFRDFLAKDCISVLMISQGCILSPCLFNLHAEYIMQNAWLAETQSGIKISRKNINNFRYADETTLIAESEEELKCLLMRMREESET